MINHSFAVARKNKTFQIIILCLIEIVVLGTESAFTNALCNNGASEVVVMEKWFAR